MAYTIGLVVLVLALINKIMELSFTAIVIVVVAGVVMMIWRKK